MISITARLTRMHHIVSDKFITEYWNMFLRIRQKFLAVLYRPVTFTRRDIFVCPELYRSNDCEMCHVSHAWHVLMLSKPVPQVTQVVIKRSVIFIALTWRFSSPEGLRNNYDVQRTWQHITKTGAFVQFYWEFSKMSHSCLTFYIVVLVTLNAIRKVLSSHWCSSHDVHSTTL